MELPINFAPFVPLINYYRNELKIDCLLTRSEQFRFYIGYLRENRQSARRPSRDYWENPEPGCQDWYYDCKRCMRGRGFRGRLNLNNEQDMFDEINKASPEQIRWYLDDLYPYKKFKKIENYDRMVVITN